MMPFLDQARALLSYEPDTGLFRWRERRKCQGGHVEAGDIAGCLGDQGYVLIGVLGQQWRASRLAWLFMTGELPPKGFMVEHEDGVRDHDWWTNLRLATRSQNGMNGGLRKNNRTGHRGVGYDPRRRHWFARITVDREVIHLGCFPTKEEAAAARAAGEAKHFGEFALKDPSRRAIARHSNQPA